VRYDDGSGDELTVTLGTTAFVSGAKAFSLLSPDQQDMACKTVGCCTWSHFYYFLYFAFLFRWSDTRLIRTFGLKTRVLCPPVSEL
jgi:hypothetical protein